MTVNSKLEKIVGSIDQLPPFPDTAMRIIDIASDPDSDADDIVEIIQYDQAITSNCLKVCNSTHSGLREKAKSVKHAVVLVGTDNLVNIAIASCSKMTAFSAGHRGYGLHPGELWRHSVSCALLSQLLLKKAGSNSNHEIFISALLHDIGKLVIDGFIADDFEAIYSLMKEDDYGFVDAEKEYFGIDHAELGGLIFDTWNFPKTLVDSVRNHHQEVKEESKNDLESWTALSNLVCYVASGFLSRSRQKDTIACQIAPGALSCFGLSAEDIKSVAYELPFEMKKAEGLLSI